MQSPRFYPWHYIFPNPKYFWGMSLLIPSTARASGLQTEPNHWVCTSQVPAESLGGSTQAMVHIGDMSLNQKVMMLTEGGNQQEDAVADQGKYGWLTGMKWAPSHQRPRLWFARGQW